MGESPEGMSKRGHGASSAPFLLVQKGCVTIPFASYSALRREYPAAQVLTWTWYPFESWSTVAS